MYTKDLDKRITLRLDDDTYSFILGLARTFNCSPSSVIRMYLKHLMCTWYYKEVEVGSHADDKTFIDDKLQQ